MDGMQFNSMAELFQRLKPALNTKKDDMSRLGLSYIMPEDIWNFLKETKWKKSSNLNLYEMVDSIMCVDEKKIDKYLKEKLSKFKRNIPEKDTNLL